MKKSAFALVFVLLGCSNSANNQASDDVTCRRALLEKRALEAASAETVVTGKWQHADPTVKMNGLEFGTIKVSKMNRGAFADHPIVEMDVEFDGGEQDDARTARHGCPLTKPLPNEERVFYIIRDGLKYRVVDHKKYIET